MYVDNSDILKSVKIKERDSVSRSFISVAVLDFNFVCKLSNEWERNFFLPYYVYDTHDGED